MGSEKGSGDASIVAVLNEQKQGRMEFNRTLYKVFVRMNNNSLLISKNKSAMKKDVGFTLYGTEGCHLCEEAVHQLQPFLHQQLWEHVDIATDDALLNEYGIRIPVLRYTATGAELNWPFDSAKLKIFLDSVGFTL